VNFVSTQTSSVVARWSFVWMELESQKIYYTVRIKAIARLIGSSKIRVAWIKKKEKGHTKSATPSENGIFYPYLRRLIL
jgi:hypothetical protein